jgi:predicted amidohydrolase
MIVGLVQVRSETGDVQGNIERHAAVLQEHVPAAVDLVVFPELSLSNYAPEVAVETALAASDPRLRPFQQIAEARAMTVAVGAPLKTLGKPAIALLVFGPGHPPRVVGKRHLHADETPTFSPYAAGPLVLDLARRVGVAICYELTVDVHTAAVMDETPDVYLASVAKTAPGVAAARATLTKTAQNYHIPTLMVNSVGTCEGAPAGGGSLVIDRSGALLAQLDASNEDVLVYDTDTGETATYGIN